MDGVRMRFRVTETGGNEYSTELSLHETASLGDYALRLLEDGGALRPVLTGPGGVPVKEVSIFIPLPEGLANGDVWMYADGTITNETRHAMPLSGYGGDATRDFMAFRNKDTGGEWALGYVTAHRFYADMVIRDGGVLLRFDMENKPLTAGEEYVLEAFMVSRPGEGAEGFLERWGDTLARVNHARPLARVPVGFCSWSRYYDRVNEENMEKCLRGVSRALRGRGANLFQIDDGWQVGQGPFPGIYVEDRHKFPSGLMALSRRVKEAGMAFGLWLSPMTVLSTSPFFEEMKPLLRLDQRADREEGADSWPLDLDNGAVYDHLARQMERLRRDYGADYFKLDFLVCAYMSIPDGFKRIYYKSDYCVALYRKALMAIRRGAGEDAVLMGCGAPLLESVGILDAARVASDIIIRWGEAEDAPSYWQLIKDVTSTTLHRWPYHRQALFNDPDGLVIRDHDVGDEFDPTYAEAKFWATQVAMSGGSVLVNEDVEALSPERRALLTRLCPPLGAAARPVDMFEGPCPTAAVMEAGDVRFAGVFHLSDKRGRGALDTARFGMERALALRCWDEKALGVVSQVDDLPLTDGSRRLLPPHAAEMYMLRPVPSVPCFLYSDVNLFGGVGLVDAHLVDGEWRVQIDPSIQALSPHVYAWVPDGQSAPGETTQTAPGGRVVRIQ